MELSAKNTTAKSQFNDEVTFGLNMENLLSNTFWRSRNASSKHDKVVIVSAIIGSLLFLHLHYAELGLSASPFFGL